MNVAHDTKEVRRVMNGRKSILVLFICLLMAHLFPLSVLAQEQEYYWGEITLQEGAQKTIYISDDYGYALDAPVYSNFWNSSDESCVRVVGSNQTKGYCVIEGLKANTSTKITCQLSFKFDKSDIRWRVYRGYYTVRVTERPQEQRLYWLSTSSRIFLGKTYTFSLSFTPKGFITNVEWSVDDPSIATISNFEKTDYSFRAEVKGVKKGKTCIKYRINNGSATDIPIEVLEEKYLNGQTVEGINMTYLVISDEDEEKTCELLYPDWLQESYKNKHYEHRFDTPKSVTIPSTVDGYTVTTIGNSAFSYSASLSSVTIPNTITHIGVWAFYNCGLTSIDIPNSVKSIGEYAFSDLDEYSNLVTVEIPEGVERIERGAFRRMKELKKHNSS